MHAVMKRNPDGTYRNARHPIVVSARFIVGRWVSAEIMACKRKGLSMAAIAVHVSRVGQGLEQPLSPIPEGIAFPPDYRISESAVYKAYHKAMDRQPAIDAEVYRKEDTARLEDMYLKLQPGIGKRRSALHRCRVRCWLTRQSSMGMPPSPTKWARPAGSRFTINLGETPLEPQQDAIEASCSPHIDDTDDE